MVQGQLVASWKEAQRRLTTKLHGLTAKQLARPNHVLILPSPLHSNAIVCFLFVTLFVKAKSKAQPKASARGRRSLRLLRLRLFAVLHSPGPGRRPCPSTARRLSRSCGEVERLLAWLFLFVCVVCLFQRFAHPAGPVSCI